jgi:hypothetical protein
MDLEELEALEAVIVKRGVALADLLRSKFNSDWRPWPVKNFLMFNDLWLRNEKVSAQWNRIIWDSGLVFGRGPRQLLEFCRIKLRHFREKIKREKAGS